MQKLLLILCLMTLSACAQFNEVDKERFQINGDNTVQDKQTELMWAAIDNRESVTWMEAEKYCNNYRGGGFDDWRLPKKSELAALIEANIQTEGKVLGISSNLIWAAETDESKGAACDFKHKGCFWMEKVISISLHALPVRDTKVTESAAATSASPVEAIKPQSPKQRLQIIDSLHKQQLITTEEYERKKAAILNEL
ncbi:MAG TPA: DUF1566 domain-containing protein [Desulfobacterales bacterium]|nr:DUF1566 domain-containing protein [Desulfobacterales bacterium]HIP40865.1 DUF1566 domain-containing protein [Desulfocapsa sulfexigens]